MCGNVVLVGAGNLASHLGKALYSKGYNILQVYSRTLKHATDLAHPLKASPITNIADVNTKADFIIISVTDNAIGSIVKQIPTCNAIVAHTAGSVPQTVLNKFANHGVFYPFQTFTKNKEVCYSAIPILVEGCSEKVIKALLKMGNNLSEKVISATSDQRKQLHLAAVFSCNFVNHLYTLADDLLKEAGLDFTLLMPLIKETTEKLETLSPFEAQTGPAVRDDSETINSHSTALANNNNLKNIYQTLSQGIYSKHIINNKGGE